MGNTSYYRTMKDVYSLTSVRQTSVCIPPEGEDCPLAVGTSALFTASQAKRHAMRHPGHVVVHRTIRETRYTIPDNEQQPPSSNGSRRTV